MQFTQNFADKYFTILSKVRRLLNLNQLNLCKFISYVDLKEAVCLKFILIKEECYGNYYHRRMYKLRGL